MEERRLKYAAGVQSFEKLRRGGNVYVDKTRFVWELVNQESPIFLSRPRRFGKSLFLSTLEAYFNGQKELFEGTYIYNLETEWRKYPVVHIDLNSGSYLSSDGLSDVIGRQLDIYEEEWDIQPSKSTTPEGRLENLILKAYKKFDSEVVVLFDEYDKPLISNLNDNVLLDDMRSILKPVYGLTKSLDKYIRFAMITGVSRFSKTSIFSDVNNLVDISFVDEFNDICGISETELNNNFQTSIANLANRINLSFSQTKEMLRANYDGYHFANPETTEGVYNPYSLMNVFKFNKLSDYWFDSGTPTFLVKNLISDHFDYKKLEGMTVSEDKLEQADAATDDPVSLLFQTGYLTIKSMPDSGLFTIGFPNEEVERSFYNLLLSYSLRGQCRDTVADIKLMKIDIQNGNVQSLVDRMDALFADIPYDLREGRENYFQETMYVVAKLLGFYTQVEYQTSDSRIDMLIETDKFVYLFELKVDKSAQVAWDQIDFKDYALKYKADNRKVFKIGINFSTVSRRIDDVIIA